MDTGITTTNEGCNLKEIAQTHARGSYIKFGNDASLTNIFLK